MALFNEILAGRFNRFAQKHFSLKGSDGAPTLGADVGLTMSYLSGYENLYLQGWDLFAAGGSITAFAANAQSIQFRNPTGSGVVATFTVANWACVTANGGSAFLWRGNTLDQTNVFGTLSLDPRTKRAGSALIHSANNGNALIVLNGSQFNLGSLLLPANVSVNFIATGTELPLLPGDTLQIVNTTLNQNMFYQVWWRERALEDSEKT